MSLVRTHDLTKRFGHVLALDRLSIDIPDRTLTLISGPNGAGKSTLLRILAGLTRPTRGEAQVFGEAPTRRRETLGYLAQGSGLYGELSVRENLEFCASLHGLGNRDVDRVIEELDLGTVSERRAGTLSLGFRRRSGLARALLPRPRLLLLDEPWNGLDAESAERLADRLRQPEVARK